MSVFNGLVQVFVHLFQKVAEHEAEPRTNAKASAFANCFKLLKLGF